MSGGDLRFDTSQQIGLGICRTGTEQLHVDFFPGTHSPARRPSRPPQAGNRRSRSETAVVVVRSILLAVAAVSVIGTSNYFAYLIGRKQVTYEELRRQVGLVVQFMDQKRVEEELAPATLKRQRRGWAKCAGPHRPDNEHNQREDNRRCARAGARRRPIPAALIDGKAVGPPDHEVRLQRLNHRRMP